MFEPIPVAPPLRHHHPLRYVILIGFLAMVLLSSEQAGQSEMVRLAAEQTALYNQTRASVVQEENLPITTIPQPVSIVQAKEASSDLQSINGTHVAPPQILHGVYLTGNSAGSRKSLDHFYTLADQFGINAVVIDIKDATGKLSYQPQDPDLAASGVGTNRIRDLTGLTTTLHEKGIYVIGRVAVFQDPFYAELHPEDAFVDTRTGAPWRDYKGIMWLRPDSDAVWDYVASIARDAYAQGFDEINLDYVRFPSDGELAYLADRGSMQTRTDTIRSFFAYVSPLLRSESTILSADLFGLTMSASDDLGIGQKLEAIAPYVDYICPMVYPSHFASGAYGIADPAAHPYDIIHQSLSRGIGKLAAIGSDKSKLRPWLQDFDLGAIYTPELVRAQITASEDLGLSSWMLWDPRNGYTPDALTRAP